MQNEKNAKGRELSNFEIEYCSIRAKQLVYTELFGSETITQLPNKIRPITMVDALKKTTKHLSLKTQPTKLSSSPEEALAIILEKEAASKLEAYNKKHKSKLTLKQRPKKRSVAALNKGSSKE